MLNIQPHEIFSRRSLCSLLRLSKDEDGRPLVAEGFVPPEHRVGVERKQCPYPGSRLHHERTMNAAALKQMKAHWSEVMAGLAFIRAGLPCAAGRPLTWLEARRVAVAAVALPGYLTFRSADPIPDRSVSGAVSALNKIMYDVVTVIDRMMVADRMRAVSEAATSPGQDDVFRRLERPASAQVLYEFAENSHSFVGPNGVCAAPPHFIQEALETLIIGADGGGHVRVADQLGDRQRFFSFVDAFFRMDLTVIALGLRNALLVQSLFDRLRALLAGRSEPALDGLQQALAPASTLRLPLGLPPGAGAIVLDITESILRETKPENLEQDTGGSLVWVGNTSWGDEIHAVIAEAATNDLRLRHRCRVELSSRAAELTKSLGVPDLVSLDDQVLDSLIGPTLRFEDGPAISAQLGERIGRWRARVGQL